MLRRALIAGLAVLPVAARAEPAIVADARAFMRAYERDLAAADRAALGGRYDPEGVFFLIAGGREFVPHARVVEDYATRWTPPQTFAFKDLHFDPAGPDAVVVNGRFLWGAAEGVMDFSYAAFLRRGRDGLKIRLESETPKTR